MPFDDAIQFPSERGLEHLLMCRDKDNLLFVQITKITTKITNITTKIPTKITKIPTKIPTRITKITTFSVPGPRSPYVWRDGPQYFQVLLKKWKSEHL